MSNEVRRLFVNQIARFLAALGMTVLL